MMLKYYYFFCENNCEIIIVKINTNALLGTSISNNNIRC